VKKGIAAVLRQKWCRMATHRKYKETSRKCILTLPDMESVTKNRLTAAGFATHAIDYILQSYLSTLIHLKGKATPKGKCAY
jgi:hypothetical protein